jgi:hypothetical protein
MPAFSQWKIIKTLHQACHLRKDKTYQMVQSLFTGKDILKTVQQVTEACEISQKDLLNKRIPSLGACGLRL